VSLRSEIELFGQAVEARGNTLARKVALTALQGVVFRSPVDTGHFRRNWRVSQGRAELNVRGKRGDGAAEGPGETLSRGQAKLQDAGWNDSIHVSNHVEYAAYLEAGSSPQAPPNGIVGLTMDEVRARFAGLVKEVRGGR
jgi:hypothetical protein